MSDDRRVITRFFSPGSEARTRLILDRVLALGDEDTSRVLSSALQNFAGRHRDIGAVFLEHFDRISHFVKGGDGLSPERRMLIGAYFTMEYSIESAALFNPSMVPHPDQTGLATGSTRFIMSLRATGEGHVSSIVFRTGVIDTTGGISFDPAGRFVERAKLVEDKLYERQIIFLKLIEMGAYNLMVQEVLDRLPEKFTFRQLEGLLDEMSRDRDEPEPFRESADNMLWLAESNYHVRFPEDASPSEVVIFPISENESRGIEDVRFVRFTEDDGRVMYYGTYTAYNGMRILPQLLETPGFREFHITTLNGGSCQNKGMALFPERIDGWYFMVSRLDGESIFIMPSKNIRFWNDATRLQTPSQPWELVQLGNCGSPVRTPHGWLLLTHGVGALRRYCMGAVLLDLCDPTRIVGQLTEPLLMPAEDEREGYVPNVVYSCGSMVHGDQLIIPYAMADSATSFATVNLNELLDHMTG